MSDRTINGLLLQMKLAPTTEERFLAEEELINRIDNTQAMLDEALKKNNKLELERVALLTDETLFNTVKDLRSKLDRVEFSLSRIAARPGVPSTQGSYGAREEARDALRDIGIDWTIAKIKAKSSEG